MRRPLAEKLALEAVVEQVRMTAGGLYDDLVAALEGELRDAQDDLLKCDKDSILSVQGRARHAAEMLDRVRNARATLETAERSAQEREARDRAKASQKR